MDAEAPEPVVIEPVWRFSIPSSAPLSRPIISVNDVYFDYSPKAGDGSKKSESQFLLQKVNFGVDLDSRIAILGANGQGKTTLLNIVMGLITPVKGRVTVNGGLRIGHFTQQHVDSFSLGLSAVENLMTKFEGSDEQTIRSFLGKLLSSDLCRLCDSILNSAIGRREVSNTGNRCIKTDVSPVWGPKGRDF